MMSTRIEALIVTGLPTMPKKETTEETQKKSLYCKTFHKYDIHSTGYVKKEDNVFVRGRKNFWRRNLVEFYWTSYITNTLIFVLDTSTELFEQIKLNCFRFFFVNRQIQRETTHKMTISRYFNRQFSSLAKFTDNLSMVCYFKAKICFQIQTQDQQRPCFTVLAWFF